MFILTYHKFQMQRESIATFRALTKRGNAVCHDTSWIWTSGLAFPAAAGALSLVIFLPIDLPQISMGAFGSAHFGFFRFSSFSLFFCLLPQTCFAFARLLALRTAWEEVGVLPTTGGLHLERMGCRCADPDQQKHCEQPGGLDGEFSH